MDLQELYNRGYRRFKFSDGEVREPCEVKPGKHSQKLRFDVGNRMWYYNDGTDNLHRGYPHVVGVEDGSMSEQSERSKRDEIQRAIEQGVSNAAAPICDDDYNEIVARVLQELDSLVERWTDEETAEDLGKTIDKSEVYEGMRVQIIKKGDRDRPFGATGTIVKDDKDQSPGVRFDPPYTRCNVCEDGEHGSYFYVNVDKMKELEE